MHATAITAARSPRMREPRWRGPGPAWSSSNADPAHASLAAQRRRRQRAEHREHFLVNLGIARDDIGPKRVFGPRRRADAAAGFLDEQRPGGGVPGRQAEFPKAIDASRGDVGEIERGSA